MLHFELSDAQEKTLKMRQETHNWNAIVAKAQELKE